MYKELNNIKIKKWTKRSEQTPHQKKKKKRMEYKYVERCSPPFVIWKMQIKTVNYSYIPIRTDGIPGQ